MSVLEHAKRRAGIIRPREVRILTIDIERSPNLLAEWSLGARKFRASLDSIVELARVICVGAKWYGQKRTMLFAEWDEGGYDAMLQAVWELLDQADIVVGYNSDNFDLKLLRAAFMEAGMDPPSPFAKLDLYKEIRHVARFESHKLDHLAERLMDERKIQNEGLSFWLQVMDHDAKAQARMGKYCKHDVDLTERLYDRVRGWIRHPNLNLFKEHRVGGCPNCGEHEDIHKRGFARTGQGTYQQFKCGNCGKYSRATHSEERSYRRAVVG